MKKVYAECHCGCHIETTNLIKNKKNQQCCPEHKRTVKERYTSCDYPGCKTIRHFKAGIVPGFCREHQDERDFLRRRKFTREYYHKNKSKFTGHTKSRRKIYDHLFDDTKLDCSHRFDCLGKYDKFNTIPCKNCKEYKGKPFCDVTNNTNRNYSVRTTHRMGI